MSWDILIMDLPHDAQTVSDIPDDFNPGRWPTGVTDQNDHLSCADR